jgi:hypothetical protein
MKRLFPITALLGCSLFLSGCMIRMTGPCLGYGCPAGTGGTGGVNALNATPQTKAPRAVTAKNAPEPARSSAVHAGN